MERDRRKRARKYPQNGYFEAKRTAAAANLCSSVQQCAMQDEHVMRNANCNRSCIYMHTLLTQGHTALLAMGQNLKLTLQHAKPMEGEGVSAFLLLRSTHISAFPSF
jgi:hypothetical protein